jgi:hypothetical protein
MPKKAMNEPAVFLGENGSLLVMTPGFDGFMYLQRREARGVRAGEDLPGRGKRLNGSEPSSL